MKYLVVGAGITGSYIARNLAEMNREVLVVEKRNHIAGNMYDFIKSGCLVQKYGPHIFHTNEDWIMKWLERFSTFEDFTLRTQVWIEDLNKFYNCPFDYSLLKDIFSKEDFEIMVELLEKEAKGKSSISIPDLMNSKQEKIKELGKKLWDWDYKLYTSKQWGMNPDEVEKEILKRVPFKLSFNSKVHEAKYECLPVDGYTEMIYRILNHKNIKVLLNTNVLDGLDLIDNVFYYNDEEVVLIYTGALDELFHYKFGKLNYRSLTFDFEVENNNEFICNGTPCVDIFPSLDKKYTRITHYNKLPIQNDSAFKVKAKEFPCDFVENTDLERYYPTRKEEDLEKFDLYLHEADQIDNLYLCGRLAEYKYYDMDKAIQSAHEVFLKIVRENINTYMITGITGYIGSQTAKRILETEPDAYIYGVIREKSKVTFSHKNLEYVIYQKNIESLKKAIERSSNLIHLGALYKNTDEEEDILNLIESNILYSSLLFKGFSLYHPNSSIVCASSFSQWDKFESYSPKSFYASTKKAVEDIAEYYKDKLSICFVTLPDTYGPNDNRNKIHNILNKNEKWPFVFNSSSKQEIILLHVYDVINIILMNLLNNIKGIKFFDLYKFGEKTTLKQLSELLTENECIFNEKADVIDLYPSKKADWIRYTDLKTIKKVLNE